MSINYTLSKEDFTNFRLKYFFKTKVYKLWLLICDLICLSIWFITLKVNYLAALTLIVIILINIIIRTMLGPYYLKKLFLTKLNSKKYNNLFAETKITINENCLNINTKLSKQNCNWKSIYALYDINNYIFIRTKSQIDILIPNIAFESFKDKELFLDNIYKFTNLELKKSYPTQIF
ncbi:YcxB family protein [Clostridium felsineum]|uniref:YcxB family protein n=1 Tax=Clostridium felsineum TaxID=36839 RepID=UPI00098C3AAE|nr:YcxB family protein [Clostridium felsineum]URZ15662.1 hypothetical protein CLFE_017080 [Clostridium felsineum DSM 794]